MSLQDRLLSVIGAFREVRTVTLFGIFEFTNPLDLLAALQELERDGHLETNGVRWRVRR